VLEIGDLVAEKFRIERVLGRGGMGYVMAARHVGLGHQVAIKILVPELRQCEEAVARFLREARAAASLLSEHVARVLDVGTLGDGAPFMLMELLYYKDPAEFRRNQETHEQLHGKRSAFVPSPEVQKAIASGAADEMVALAHVLHPAGHYPREGSEVCASCAVLRTLIVTNFP